MIDQHGMWIVLTIFLIGYGGIIFEAFTKVNKGAAALLTALATWVAFFYYGGTEGAFDVKLHILSEGMFNTCQVLFFLLGALVIVEIMSHYGAFSIVTALLKRVPRDVLPWGVSIFTFFLSSVIDNLTTTVVMLSLVRGIVSDRQLRWLYGGMIVFAANAGGAWTPIGDVATTLLWINEKISTVGVIKEVFIPAFISNLVASIACIWQIRLRDAAFKNKMRLESDVSLSSYKSEKALDRSSLRWNLVFLLLGVSLLISVPVISTLTHLPPFMIMMGNVGVLWCFTDIWHLMSKNGRNHAPKVLEAVQRVDYSVILFYFGLILSIHALSVAGVFQEAATWIVATFNSPSYIALLIGLLSAVVDNVSLVAALIAVFGGKYASLYPADSRLWLEVAYTAGVGGSITIIGSAAGVAMMSLEKCSFGWFIRHIAPFALAAYLIGWLTFIAF